jgi:hypothetical protein
MSVTSEAVKAISAARTESDLEALAKAMKPEDLEAVLLELRTLKDDVHRRLRVLVRVRDDRVELENLRKTNPRLAQRIENAGSIDSRAAVGNVGGTKKSTEGGP